MVWTKTRLHFSVKDIKDHTFNQIKERSYLENPCLKAHQPSGKRLNVKKDKYGRMYRNVAMRSVWEIRGLFRNDRERMGYPTQKPLALLERIIKAFTNQGSIVADFFCGCGTTVSAAQMLGPKWIGADISRDAISVIRKRMARDHKLKIEVINTDQPTRTEIYGLNPFEFERKMVELLGGTPNKIQVGDGGIDGRM